MDLALHVGGKLSGEWSAASATGMLSDPVIQYLTGKWDSLEPLARARLLISPLFLRRKELEELSGPLQVLAAAGAADRDEWVRVTAKAVAPYDGRLHTAAVATDPPLVRKTVTELRRLLDGADAAIYRPKEEVYFNKNLLQRLRGGKPPGVPPHQHFRPRAASEAPSAKAAPAPGLVGSSGQRPAAAAAAAPAAASVRRPSPPTVRPGAVTPPPGRPAQRTPAQLAEVDIFLKPSRPANGRPLTGAGAGGVVAGRGGERRGLARVKRTAMLDPGTVAQLNDKTRAEREARLKAEREAREAAQRERDEQRVKERTAREAEREAQKAAARAAAEKAKAEFKAQKEAEKAAAQQAKEAEKAAAKAAKETAKHLERDAQRQQREAARHAREGEVAQREAPRQAGQRVEKRRRVADDGSGGEEPTAQRVRAGGGGGLAAVLGLEAGGPQDAGAALGQAALLAAAESLGIGTMQDVDAMAAQLATVYGGSIAQQAQAAQQARLAQVLQGAQGQMTQAQVGQLALLQQAQLALAQQQQAQQAQQQLQQLQQHLQQQLQQQQTQPNMQWRRPGSR